MSAPTSEILAKTFILFLESTVIYKIPGKTPDHLLLQIRRRHFNYL
jgi:hypothetical protein